MSQTKRASKGKRPSKAVSVLGMAGTALASSVSESVADIPVADMLPQNTIPFQVVLGEEEITDVSLATFHLFDKDDLGTVGPRIQLARGGCRRGGDGWGVGCRGCFARGCFRSGCGCGWGGCGGCGWGWGGCCLSRGGCYLC